MYARLLYQPQDSSVNNNRPGLCRGASATHSCTLSVHSAELRVMNSTEAATTRSLQAPPLAGIACLRLRPNLADEGAPIGQGRSRQIGNVLGRKPNMATIRHGGRIIAPPADMAASVSNVTREPVIGRRAV